MAVNRHTTVVGVFTDRAMAEQAMQALADAGFSREHIRYSGSAPDSSGGGFLEGIRSLFAAPGASGDDVANDLSGMGLGDDEARYYAHEHNNGRTVLAVKAEGREQEAQSILQRFGAYSYDGARGLDNPTAAGAVQPSPAYAQPATDYDQRSNYATPQADNRVYDAQTQVVGNRSTDGTHSHTYNQDPVAARDQERAQAKYDRAQDKQAQAQNNQLRADQDQAQGHNIQAKLHQTEANHDQAQADRLQSKADRQQVAGDERQADDNTIRQTRPVTPNQPLSTASAATAGTAAAGSAAAANTAMSGDHRLEDLQNQYQALQQQLRDAQSQLQAAKAREQELRTVQERETQYQSMQKQLQEAQTQLQSTLNELHETQARISHYDR